MRHLDNSGSEGEIALAYPGAAGDPTKPTIWAHDGSQWRVANPDASITVSSLEVQQTNPPNWAASVAAEINLLNSKWVVATGEVPIVTWNSKAYAFTGGAGDWGATGAALPADRGTAVSSGQFAELGAAAAQPDPEVEDWSARTEANPGDAYTAWNTGTGNPDFTGSPVIIGWKDGKTYVLVDSANPGDGNSYIPISQSPVTKAVNFGTDPTVTGAASVQDAYTAWNALNAANVFDPNAATTLVTWKNGLYLVTAPGAPTAAGSYTALTTAPEALAFRAAIDVTVPLVAPMPTVGWNVGDFAVVENNRYCRSYI